jgi:nitrate/nitrite transport system substrate-binding protein
MKKNTPAPTLSRRSFLQKTGKGLTLAALATGLPKGWVGGAYAAEGPETADLKIGIIALTDCSPFVIAHEKGFFKKYGIKSTIAKQASWAAIRDALSGGTIQATHMLLGMPFASTMGLAGSPVKPMVIPWLVNRNGQAVTLANKFKGKVKDDPKALKPFVDEAKGKGTPLSFAMTFPPGTHAMWIRYYLAAGGIHPDKDISLITIPPPQMVQNMKIGKMDGFCVGEPWNNRAIDEGVGYTSITTQKMWKNHPEKVCAFTAEFAEKNPKAVKAVLKALHDASTWLDNMDNRSEACDIVSVANYINCPKEIILERMLGIMKYGDGRQEKDPDPMIFSTRNCNYPQAKYGKWWLSQFRRWGMVSGAPDYNGITAKVLRGDLYEEAMKEIGYSHGGADNSPETLFDGKTFDPANPEAYATGFAINSMKG